MNEDQLFQQALLAHQADRLDIAEAAYIQLLNINRRHPNAWQNLGVLYRQSKKYQLSVVCYKRALQVMPDNAGTLSNLGNVLKDLDRLDEAVDYTARACELEPDNNQLRHNYAIALREGKHFQQALEQLEHCLEQTPDNPNLLWDRAFVLLYLQNYRDGWPAFESRWLTGDLPAPVVPEGCQRWDGSHLNGKKLLLLPEQGFGDTLFAARYIPQVIERGGSVVMACQPPLRRVLSALPIEFIDPKDPRPLCDYFCPLMSLPGLFIDQQPQPVPLHVPRDAGQKLLPGLKQDAKQLQVGIIWSGSTTYGDNSKRALPLNAFIPLLEQHPDICFYSLQKGPCEKELYDECLLPLMPDLGSQVQDFADTAAVLQQLDLLLMTDSATAHLAASLGTPVINLLQYKPYWLYYPEQSTTPWYPSMRFIRQSSPGDWEPVLEQASKVLTHIKAGYSQPESSPAQLLQLIDQFI